MIMVRTSVSIALAVVLLIGTLLIATMPAAGQSGSENETTPQEIEEQIDSNTVLLDAGLETDTGMAWVTIRSDRAQAITVTDAGAFMEGGEVPQRTVAVSAGERTTIKVPATQVNGYAGVSITTDNTLYAVPLEVQTSMFSGDASWGTAQVAGAAGFVGGLFSVVALAWYRVRGGRQEVHHVV